MKIKMLQTADAATKKATKQDNDFIAGQIYLVSEEVGELLIDKGIAVELEKKPS